MKKVFIVTGELSGDRLAAWYLKREYGLDTQIEAIGGDYLQAAGARLHARFETLNVTGIVEIIQHIPRLLGILKKLQTYLCSNNFDEIVLVDFPGFNLRLARMLKQQMPNLKITYLSPPQTWCWGAWRVKKLKKYCDRLVVLYPFEVAWYASHGLNAVWLGNPVYEALKPFMLAQLSKKNQIALIPGSRVSEIERLLPTLLKAAHILKEQFPEVGFVMPIARSLPDDLFKKVIQQHNLESIWTHVRLIRDEAEKYTTLTQCAVALSKPGTVTLELALLKVPTVVFYKTSWLTYFLAWCVVKVPCMSLPNLILNKIVFPEFIQYNVTPSALASAVADMYKKENNGDLDTQIMRDFRDLEAVLAVSEKTSIL